MVIIRAASTQTDVLGYYACRSTSLNGYYERQSADPVSGPLFTDVFPESGTNFYLQKRYREETPSGIFRTLSTGVSVNLNFVLGVTARHQCSCDGYGPTLRQPLCHEPDPCGPDVSCDHKGPTFMDLPPVTITQPGTFISHVTSLVTGCTASEIK
ncbi:MAG: hypothetical protein IPM82_21790 [Saprospiraceae bacterium]|nr:hypothetical protein [Saprospiraceae bacterium]